MGLYLESLYIFIYHLILTTTVYLYIYVKHLSAVILIWALYK